MRQPWEQTIFAPTPPLESLRSILSLAATDLDGRAKHVRAKGSPQRTQVSVIDIKRAYFNARAASDKPTYVELPPEDPDSETMCARLMRHMYGTRGAADGWQQEYSSTVAEASARNNESRTTVEHTESLPRPPPKRASPEPTSESRQSQPKSTRLSQTNDSDSDDNWGEEWKGSPGGGDGANASSS